jgi:CHAT domain-containing protein
MGRWLENQHVMLPPAVEINVRQMTVVAAKYGLGSDQRELKEAVAEQSTLKETWKAMAFEAKRAELMAVVSGAIKPGHLIHFAVHGSSEPMANHQSLLLADKTTIPASALTGRYKCGDEPRFAFVFLNACYVGTAGESLGQAAGFPGILVRGGARGFIAPLWQVDDKLAREMAENFYEETFKQQKTVGEVLQSRRCRYDRDGSTTPLAYVYYGHPALRLNYQPKGG